MLTRREAKQLLRTINDAIGAVEEHAVEQAWRADAMHQIRERLVESYHRNQHDNAIELLSRLRTSINVIERRLDAADRRAS